MSAAPAPAPAPVSVLPVAPETRLFEESEATKYPCLTYMNVYTYEDLNQWLQPIIPLELADPILRVPADQTDKIDTLAFNEEVKHAVEKHRTPELQRAIGMMCCRLANVYPRIIKAETKVDKIEKIDVATIKEKYPSYLRSFLILTENRDKRRQSSSNRKHSSGGEKPHDHKKSSSSSKRGRDIFSEDERDEEHQQPQTEDEGQQGDEASDAEASSSSSRKRVHIVSSSSSKKHRRHSSSNSDLEADDILHAVRCAIRDMGKFTNYLIQHHEQMTQQK